MRVHPPDYRLTKWQRIVWPFYRCWCWVTDPVGQVRYKRFRRTHGYVTLESPPMTRAYRRIIKRAIRDAHRDA